MTPLLVALRRGSAPVGVPLLVGLGLYAGTRGDPWAVDWGWTSGRLQQHGVLLAPFTAALAAWDASRDRRAGSPLLTRTYPGSPLPWLLLDTVGPVLAGLAGWLTAFTVVALNVQGDSTPYWSVVLLGPFCAVAAALVGAVAGQRLHRYLAAPIVAVAVWVGLAFGSGGANPWYARLNAVDHECCDVASQPVPATVTGQWLWIAALALGAVAVLALPALVPAGPFAVGALVLGFVAVSLIRSTGGQLTEARRAVAEACGTQDGVTVCMWPEHATSVAAWLDATSRYRTLFADLGPVPDLYLENGLRPDSAARRVGPVRPGADEVHLVTDLALRLVPAPPACAVRGDSTVPYPAAEGDAVLTGWLVHRVRPDVPTGLLVPADQAARLDRLVGSPTDRQAAWYAELVRAHRDCTTPAPPVP